MPKKQDNSEILLPAQDDFFVEFDVNVKKFAVVGTETNNVYEYHSRRCVAESRADDLQWERSGISLEPLKGVDWFTWDAD